MPKTKVYSVRLQSLTSISPKCYKAKAYDGSECLIPKSMVFGDDYEVQNSSAYWISAWLLEQKEIQYSTKKTGWYNPETGEIEPNFNSDDYIVEKHIPERVEPKETHADPALLR